MKQKQKPLSFSLNPLNIEYIESVVSKQKETNSRYSRSMYMDDLLTHLRTKAEAKPVKKKISMPVVNDEIPEGLNVIAWRQWLDFRKKAKFKAYKTDSAMKKLAKMGSLDEQMKIVQQSIDNEYQGLFELKGGSNSAQGKTSGNLSACEAFING